MPRKKVICLNEIRIMKNGMKSKCIAYRYAKDIDIQFEDGTIVRNVQKKNFYNGTIMNPNSDYKPHRKINVLTITNPELVRDWDYKKNVILPQKITRSYNKKVWWKCKNGHSWQASVVARAKKHGTGCPYCNGNLPIKGTNDFKTKNPELMLDWDYNKNKNLDPEKITAYSGVYIHWKCHFCGYEWKTRGNNRSSAKRGCPNCSMKSTSFGEQAVYFYVKKIFPNAINRYRDGKFELDIFIPDIKTAIEFDGAYFHKGKDNDIREKNKYKICQKLGINLIRIKDSNSMEGKYNANYTIGIDNLQSYDSLNKAIRILLQDLDPESNSWTRKNPLQFWSTIDSIINVEKDYFQIVSNKYLKSEANSFVNEKPELLNDWDYELNKNMNPKSITHGCSFKINWKCHVCGYKWKARISDRIRGDGCPCCNKNVLVKGVNDFATLYPKELIEWDYERNTIKPDTIISYNKKVAWKCSKCGYRWMATISDKVIRKNRTGCPDCAKRTIAEKRHQRAMKNGGLFDRFPELLRLWDNNKNKNVNINDISAGSPKRYWWKCPDCNYEWLASPNNKTRGGHIGTCPKCRNKNENKKTRNRVN